VAGLVIVLAMVLAAAAAPLITPYDPNAQDLLNAYAHPSADHWLGTDQLGRDVYTRLIFAGRVDLLIGFFAVFFPFCIGLLLGSLAGYHGGVVDTAVMRFVDVVVAFPFLVIVIALVFVLGAGARSIVVAITMVGWVSYARIIRGEVLVQKRQEYTLAAKAAGLGGSRIMLRHLLPNVVTQAIVFAMSDIVLSILSIVTLGYLGLGVPPPTADWGSMIADGESLLTTQWQIATFPGLAVVLVGLGLSLLGDGLADLLRPE
jgi:peptide/nickel transport system permease protein